MSLSFEESFSDLTFDRNEGKSYFFTNGKEKIYKYLLVSNDTFARTNQFLLDSAFGPWPIPEAEHRLALDSMKKIGVNSCEVFLKCTDVEGYSSICVVPYLEELHNYFSKGNLGNK